MSVSRRKWRIADAISRPRRLAKLIGRDGGELAYLAISDGAEAAANHGNCALRRASPSCGPNRPADRSAQAADARLRLVHRGLRHRRSEGRKGAAPRTDAS